MEKENPNFSGSEIAEIGIEIEKNGRDFYNRLADRLKDRRAKELFRYMAGEEEKHIEDFKKIFSSVSSHSPCESYPPEYFAYLNAIASEYVFTKKDELKERIKDIVSEKDAIDVSLGLEKDSILFYGEMKKIIPEKDYSIIDAVITQEKEHVEKLWDMRVRIMSANEKEDFS